jgi:hypothetical protein
VIKVGRLINYVVSLENMSINQSKTKEARFWKKWIESGAVGRQGSKLHYCLKHDDGILRGIAYKVKITPDSRNVDKIISPLEFTMSRVNIHFFSGSGEGANVFFDVPNSYVGKPVEALHSFWYNDDGSETKGVLLSSKGKVIGQQYITQRV